jgi:hypothetical protein
LYIRASFIVIRRLKPEAIGFCGRINCFLVVWGSSQSQINKADTFLKWSSIMPTHISADQNALRRRISENPSPAESGIAWVWLVFYVLALGVAISSPMVSRMIEFAALTGE